MNDQTALRYVEHPVFDDTRAGVKRSLGREIERQTGVSDLNDKPKVVGLAKGRGRFSPFLSIKSPSTSSRRSFARNPEDSSASHSARVQRLRSINPYLTELRL